MNFSTLSAGCLLSTLVQSKFIFAELWQQCLQALQCCLLCESTSTVSSLHLINVKLSGKRLKSPICSNYRNFLPQVIDAAQNIENVHKDITAHSLNAINKAQNLPLGELWSETLQN